MEIIIIAIVAALGAAYFVNKNSVPSIKGVSNINGTPVVQLSNGQVITAASLTPSPPPAPHLKPNAVLLTDDQIANMNLSIGFSASNRTAFIKEVPKMLAVEQLIDTGTSLARQCGGSLQYKGQPLSLSILKDGSLALGTAEGLAAAGVFGGGGVGSLAGIGSTGFAAAGTAAATAIPIIGIGIGAAISILSAITAHHAAAVRNEQSLECQLIPSANQALTVIENAVMTGNLTPKQGQSALATLLSDFKRQAQNGQSGQLHEASGACNALCWYYHFLGAIVMRKQNRYSQFV